MYYCNKTVYIFDRQVVLTLVFLFTAFFSSPQLMAKEFNNGEQKNNATEFTRSIVNYEAPDVAVVRNDGKKLSFIKEIDDGRPVIMNFIFASCSAICPMISHVFSKVQTKLDQDSLKVHLMSISIDPENDTPAILSEYADKFGAGPDWNYYTGTREASIAIQKAFNAYRGDKMNHTSLTLIRRAPGKPWLRLEGFVSPDAVIREYRDMI